MSYADLVALRTEFAKLAKKVDAAAPPESDTYAENLWAMIIMLWRATLWVFDELLKVTVNLRQSRAEFASQQTALELVPKERPTSVSETAEIIHAFLQKERIEDPGDLDGSDGRVYHSELEEPPSVALSGVDLFNLLSEAQKGRDFPPPEVIDRWTEGERISAGNWASAVIEGSKAPAPEVLLKRYLEDLDMSEVEGWRELLSWVGIYVVSDTDWSNELWDEVLEWAEAAHRIDRGEHYEEFPTLPEIFAPDQSFLDSVQSYVFEQGAPSVRATIDYFSARHGIRFALLALIGCGELRIDIPADAVLDQAPPVNDLLELKVSCGQPSIDDIAGVMREARSIGEREIYLDFSGDEPRFISRSGENGDEGGDEEETDRDEGESRDETSEGLETEENGDETEDPDPDDPEQWITDEGDGSQEPEE